MSRNPSSFIGKSVQFPKISVTIKEKIGEGGYAWVYRAEDQQKNQYAYKYVNCLTKERYIQFKKEATVLESLPEHPNIVKMHGFVLNERQFEIHFLFEYCPLTAIGILTNREMTKEEILIFFHAACEATAFLHSQKPLIVHRDIKPENLLVAQDGTPRLCDFGSATTTIYTISKPEEINIASDDIERNTTQNYRSPEMVDLYKRVPIGAPSDVWALGCTLFKLIFRDDMYKPEDRLPILQGKVNLPSACDKELSDLIYACIKVDAKQRPNAQQLSNAVKQLRGPKNTIYIPPKQQPIEESTTETEQQGSWNFIKSIQETYRSITSIGPENWIIKATKGDSSPPAAEFVRRIILATIRRTELDPIGTIDYLMNKRPWQSDVIIAAKSLYLVLLIIQYQVDISPFVSLTVKADQIMAHFSTGAPEEVSHKAYTVVSQLGVIVRQKLMLHATNKELEGNLALGKKTPGPQLAKDLKHYLKYLVTGAKTIITESKTANDFSAICMCQPAIEEIVNVIRLLQNLEPQEIESLSLFQAARKLLDEAKQIPYLDSSVLYPNYDSNDLPPLSRFG